MEISIFTPFNFYVETATLCIITKVSLALTITNVPFIIHFKHWCKDDVITPAACVQGLPNKMLYNGWMFITCKVTKNTYGLMNSSTSMVPTTFLKEPS